MLNIGIGDRIAAVVAHPDDAELMFYGTLLLAREAGAEVMVIVASDGEYGVSLAESDHMSIAPNERVEETRNAYVGTGVTVRMLGLQDGSISAGRSTILAIEATLLEFGCTILLTHAVQQGNDHQDHHAVARAAVNVGSRMPTCRAILHGQPVQNGSTFNPTLFVDVTHLMEQKVRALASHQTQEGRWYLSDEYTRHRAREHAWRYAPQLAAKGHFFEAFEQRFLVLRHDSNLDHGENNA